MIPSCCSSHKKYSSSQLWTGDGENEFGGRFGILPVEHPVHITLLDEATTCRDFPPCLKFHIQINVNFLTGKSFKQSIQKLLCIRRSFRYQRSDVGRVTA